MQSCLTTTVTPGARQTPTASVSAGHPRRTLGGMTTGTIPESYRDLSVSGRELPRLFRSSAIPTTFSAGVLPINISDFDGTMIRDSSGSFTLDYAIEHNFFLPVIRPRLNGMLALFGLTSAASESPESPQALARDIKAIKQAYEQWLKAPGVPHDERVQITKSFYEMCSWIFAGHTRDEMHAFTRAVLTETGFGANYFDYARDAVSALRECGIETMLVSATLQPIVEEAARFLGIEAEQVMGINLETDEEGHYLPCLRAPVTFREGKVDAARILMARYLAKRGMPGYPADYRPYLAMGDSPSKTDEQLLAMAEVAIVVEPQTPHDAEIARDLFTAGRRGFFVDYEGTITGEKANRFNRSLNEQRLPQGNFL